MNNYNTKVNTYVQKTHQSACTQTHQRVPKIHQKNPKKATNCIRITRLQTMHQSAQNAHK